MMSRTRRLRPSKDCVCVTPNVASCVSRHTGTSRGRSNGRCAERVCRWRSRRASARTRRSPGWVPRRPAPPARPSTSRSRSSPRSTRRRCGRPWTRRCRPASTWWRPWSPAGGIAGRADRRQPVAASSYPASTAAELGPAVAALLAADAVEVERLTKDGRRRMDVRPAVVSLRVQPDQTGGSGTRPRIRQALTATASAAACGILDLVVRQTTPAVRPDDVLSALRVVAALMSPVPAKATRTAQGRLDDEGHLADPLAPDRGPVSEPVAGEPEPGQHAVERPAG